MIITLYNHVEYPIGLVLGFIGQSIGFGQSLDILHLTQKVVDGFIGLMFMTIGVIITHFLKKFLEKRTENKNKNDKIK